MVSLLWRSSQRSWSPPHLALVLGTRSTAKQNEGTTLAAEGAGLVHFDTRYVRVYRVQDGLLKKLAEQRHAIADSPEPGTVAEATTETWHRIRGLIESANCKSVRLYATGVFQNLSPTDATKLVIRFFVDSGLYFNIVEPELEGFYLKGSGIADDASVLMRGILRQEFRRVVVCGSFQQSLGYIEGVIDRLRSSGATVLSPPSTRIKPETKGTDFILFDYQDHLENERDTWRHKYIHMDKFRHADAVIVCNPGGAVGQGTLFELGFMSAVSKRVIFTERPVGLSVFFPSEVGLEV